MHDCKGRPLKIGDRVKLEGLVVDMCEGTDRCNITVDGAHPLPGATHPDRHTFTAATLEKVEDVPTP